jgi:hypothetical protein
MLLMFMLRSSVWAEGGGGSWGFQLTEIPKIWQSWAQFPVPWKIPGHATAVIKHIKLYEWDLVKTTVNGSLLERRGIYWQV